jgi:hypothetical protein
MKKTIKKTSSKLNQKSIVAKKSSVKKKLVKKTRPIHKKLALHPINILFMLVLGVILVMSTINAAADSVFSSASYSVSATVPLPPGPSAPAVMSSPSDGEQFSGRVTTVTGYCPADPYTSVYVALFTNNIWTGYTNCTSTNTFELTTTLYPGANTIQVRVFDNYNTPGPLLPPVTVTYNPPISTQEDIGPSVVAPEGIQVLQEDNDVPYISQTQIQYVSIDPTITGTAPPFSHVQVTIHSNPILCETTADSQGYWSCRVDQTIPLGLHHIYVVATTLLGKVLTFQTFQFIATNKVAAATPTKTNFTITSNFKPTNHLINQPVTFDLNVGGGIAPYAFSVDWGDGTTSDYTRLASGPVSLTHSYGTIDALVQDKTIKIEGIDSQGDTTSLQLFTVIKNPAYKNIVSYISQSTGLWSVFLSIKSWLWLIWPAYVVIMLMIFSFWLGEREELIILINRRLKKRKLATKRH